MATVKVSALTALTSPDGAEELLINDGGTSKKITIDNVTENNFTDTLKTKLDAIEASADVTDATNVTAAGALMDSELANIAAVKATTGTFLTADQSKLDAIEASADVTDATNVTAAGALMDSEVTNLAEVKAFAASDYATAAQGTLAANALPKAGGTMTGNIVMGTNLVDGIDISARDAVLTSTTTTADAALPKAGGTMTGDLILGDNVKIEIGSATGGDLQIYHDGSHSYISDQGTGDLTIQASNDLRLQAASTEAYLTCNENEGVEIYHDNTKKFETTANGVTVTGGAVGTMTTDNDGSFAMSASNNFKCTPAGDFALTFTAIVAQSGNILLVNSGGHTVSAHANTKVDANLLATVSTAGTYLLSYFSDGTNVYMTNSAVYT